MTKDYRVRVYRFDGQKWNLNMFRTLKEFKQSKRRRDLVRCAVKTISDTVALLYVLDEDSNLVARNIVKHGADSVFVVIYEKDHCPDYILGEQYSIFPIPKKFKEESLKC